MKKILGIVVVSLFLSSSLFAGVTTGYKYGKGPLKLTTHMVNELEYYFSGGKKGVYAEKQKYGWKPGLIAVSVDGNSAYFFRHPFNITDIDSKHYAGIAIAGCKKKSNQECFLFANAYKIVWDNGSNKKKRRLKRKDIKAGNTIALLTELGFYNEGNLNTTKPKITKNKDNKKLNNDDDVVKKLKDLKDLLDSGAITKEEFKKAKKKILN